MKLLLQTLILFLLSNTLLYSAPARGGAHTYKQPDGTTFRAYLRGDASFHWMEDEEGLIVYNKDDGYFYRGKIDTKNIKIYRTDEKVSQSGDDFFHLKSAPSRNFLSSPQREMLIKFYKESKKGPHPR